jgi:hypothetical protein
MAAEANSGTVRPRLRRSLPGQEREKVVGERRV